MSAKNLVARAALSMAVLTWVGFALVLAFVAGCDPVWGAHVKVRGPDHAPVRDTLLAIACPGGDGEREMEGWVARTDAEGTALVGSLGTEFPPDCDLYIAAPGLPVRRIAYAQLCPGGSDKCERYVDLDLLLAP